MLFALVNTFFGSQLVDEHPLAWLADNQATMCYHCHTRANNRRKEPPTVVFRVCLVYQARPSFVAAFMPFQHTQGKEGLADVIYIHI